MADQKSKEIEQLEAIENQINEALKDLEAIRNNKAILTNPKDLEEAEGTIVNATDKIAGLLTALKIQQAVASEDLKENSTELVRNIPTKLKSQGVRLVSVQTSRGEPVDIATRYYSRKKKKKTRRKKKNS